MFTRPAPGVMRVERGGVLGGLVPACVGDALEDLLAAELLEIVGGRGGPYSASLCWLPSASTDLSCYLTPNVAQAVQPAASPFVATFRATADFSRASTSVKTTLLLLSTQQLVRCTITSPRSFPRSPAARAGGGDGRLAPRPRITRIETAPPCNGSSSARTRAPRCGSLPRFWSSGCEKCGLASSALYYHAVAATRAGRGASSRYLHGRECGSARRSLGRW